MPFRRMLAVLACFATAALGPLPARADAVADWLSTLQQISGRAPPASAAVVEQALPMAALAIYDAVIAVEGGYRPWLGPLEPSPGASAAAAAHSAAHAVLLQLFPLERDILSEAYEAGLTDVADAESRERGVAVGLASARRLMQQRGLDQVAPTTAFRPLTHPGRFVPPQLPAREWMASLRPFIVPAEFRTPGPPRLDSDSYAADHAEVQASGGRWSARRTPEQTAVAQFWHSTDLMQLLPQVFARENRSLAANARLLAIYATAQFDAAILLARDKYHHGFWRPVTAIRNADKDDNPATVIDATWEPLLATPSHPDYPCGHCLMGALVASIMEAELGPSPDGGITVSAGGSAAPAVRGYARFAQMAEEISSSRVWGGVHFRQGAVDGAEMGRKVARYILANAFVPVRTSLPSRTFRGD
jgi:hypothetical protein